MIVISGGPITAPVTLPEALSTQLEPSATEVKSSLASISTQISSAMPLLNDWLDAPDSDKASSAIEAINHITGQVGDLIQNLPDGGGILNNCEAEGEGLPYELNRMLCELIDMLGGLQSGQTAELTPVNSIIEGVRGDAGEVQSDLSNVMGIVNTQPPITSQDVQSTNIITTSTTESTISSQLPPPIIMTSMPPGATLLPLPDYTGTSPVYTETTLPGDNKETTVPGKFAIISFRLNPH